MYDILSWVYCRLTFEIFTYFGAIAGFIFTIIRLRSANERAKGALSVNILTDWANTLDIKTETSAFLAEKIDEDSIKLIWEKQPCSLPKKFNTILESIFNSSSLSTNNEVINLTETQVLVIYYHWASYLNKLEFMLEAWKNELVDPNIMNSQLGGFLDSKEKKKRLTRLTKGDSDFSHINNFLKGQFDRDLKRSGFRKVFFLATGIRVKTDHQINERDKLQTKDVAPSSSFRSKY